ncbi:MAG TPA: DUF2231 domain-containing protein [Vicinamibacterales bacterium]|nr:DUF2231 domain-containing protein [Vicinamibacterales bacterium]
MESRAKLLGHPIHQMLIVFPLGLLATAVIFDLIFLIGGNPLMAEVAYWLISAGIIGGLIAAPFGTIDWLAIPRGTRAKRIGLMHGAGNVIVLLLFIGSWSLRRETALDPAWTAHLLSFLGAGLALVTAWLGGELVDRLGVGVSDAANLDAPSSLHDVAAQRSGITPPR